MTLEGSVLSRSLDWCELPWHRVTNTAARGSCIYSGLLWNGIFLWWECQMAFYIIHDGNPSAQNYCSRKPTHRLITVLISNSQNAAFKYLRDSSPTQSPNEKCAACPRFVLFFVSLLKTTWIESFSFLDHVSDMVSNTLFSFPDWGYSLLRTENVH